MKIRPNISYEIENGLVDGMHTQDLEMLKRPNQPKWTMLKKEVTMLEAKIMVIKAKDLAVADFSMGFIPIGSDPYVQVRLMKDGPGNCGGDSVLFLGQTKVIEKNVNPVWDEVFSVTLPRENVSNDAIFHLKIFDKDINTEDDLLGVVKIPLLDCLKNLGGKPLVETKWYNVEGSVDGQGSQGKVRCSIKLKETKRTIVH